MTENYGRHLLFPFHIGKDGRTAQVTSLEAHIHDELIQLILTNLGERAFLPEFGGGIRHFIFENIDETTAGVKKAMITQAITRWLGHRIIVEDIVVNVQSENIDVEIKYRIAGTEDARIMRFQRSGE